jgi:hypothetical protein
MQLNRRPTRSDRNPVWGLPPLLAFALLGGCPQATETRDAGAPPTPPIADAGASPVDAGGSAADAGAANECPPLAERPEPTLTHRFEDGSPEVTRRQGQFSVIVPEGHEALAEQALAVLPSCHEAIAERMGYCHPWREVIVHFGRNDSSKGKASDGVVNIGRNEAGLSQLDRAEAWPGAPAICGDQYTVAHESVHTFQPANLPAWLKEGFADYFAKIVVGGMTYRCEETSLCVLAPPSNNRPPPDECPSPVEYWNLSDPDWSGERPDPGEEPDPNNNGAVNKSRYYKTGTCFWQSLIEAYGDDALRQVMQKMHAEPSDELAPFPFSAEANALLIGTYFEPILGDGVWSLIARYGIEPIRVP